MMVIKNAVKILGILLTRRPAKRILFSDTNTITFSNLVINSFNVISLKCENSAIKLNLQIGLNDGADISALNTLSLNGGSVTCDVDENDVAVYVLLSEGGASDD